MKLHSLITSADLKKLLHALKDGRPDVCMRCRFLGQMWMRNFCRVLRVTERGAILHDETLGEMVTIVDLANIMQFELDQSFWGFQPHYFYDVQAAVVTT